MSLMSLYVLILTLDVLVNSFALVHVPVHVPVLVPVFVHVQVLVLVHADALFLCLLYTSPSPRD